MPIGKVDNVTIVNNKITWFTGKAIRIGTAARVITIRYVLNADEVVAFISEAIEKAKDKQAQTFMRQTITSQTDVTDSIKKLADLKAMGAITEEEFERKKGELLDKM